MTHDELVEKVIDTIIKNPPNRTRVRDAGFLEYTDTIDHTPTAVALINTILAALQEPSEEMAWSVRHMLMWLGEARPTEKSLLLWCERRGLQAPDGCENVDHVPPKAAQAYWLWQAMLAASPLASTTLRERE